MIFAIMPSTDEQLNDAYFKDSLPDDDRSVSNYHVKGLRREINNRGDEIHTIDIYEKQGRLKEIDVVFLTWPRWTKIYWLLKHGLLEKTIYTNAEPTSVIPENCPEGYKRLKKIFPKLLTWNSDWVDNEHIFKKNIPYPFYTDFGNASFEEKKLLTAITADKFSSEEGELYSERRNVYSFFETNYPDDFDFYGIRWKKDEHPAYKGTVDDKLDIFHKYRFAICLENTKGARDYVTEKIFDCLCAGIVPIYGGAPNITDYVPSDCYIDYFNFESYDSMAAFLMNMDRATYEEYIDRIKKWLETIDLSAYSIERYVEYIYFATEAHSDFYLTSRMKIYVASKAFKEGFRDVLVGIKHKLIK